MSYAVAAPEEEHEESVRTALQAEAWAAYEDSHRMIFPTTHEIAAKHREEAMTAFAAQAEDVVHQPSHYSRFVIEPATFNMANKLNFLEGNIVKYVVRAPYKNGREDLLKARRCIDMLIESMERAERIEAGEDKADVWKVML